MLTKPAKRDLKHNRTIKGKGYKREEGLWDIEVFLLDTKTFSFKNMHRSYISAGEPLHDMAIRLTLDDDRKIIDIEALRYEYLYKNIDKYSNDIIVANISSKVILDLSKEITEYLKPKGYLLISGFLDINESEIIDVFKKLNLNVVSKLGAADWVALCLRNF